MSEALEVRVDRSERDIIAINGKIELLTQKDNDIILKEHQKFVTLEKAIKEHIDQSTKNINDNLAKKVAELDERLTKLENAPAEKALAQKTKLFDRISDKAIDRIATIIVGSIAIALLSKLGGG